MNPDSVQAPPYGSVADLAETLIGDRPLARQGLWLGSLPLRLETSNQEFFPMLEELLRVEAAPTLSPTHCVPLQIISVDEDRLRTLVPLPDQGTVDYPHAHTFEIHRDAAVCFIDSSPTATIGAHTSTQPRRILITLRATEPSSAHLLHCLMVVLYRALFHLHRMPLHAAAIEIPDLGACLFVGDKGAGKSTLSMELGLRGATVLGEDHVMLQRRKEGFWVSGCDGRLRLTQKSERHFFARPLDEPALDIGGVTKKEVDLSLYVHSEPYRDALVRRIYFPRVGRALRVRPLSGMAVVVRLLALCRERHRFVGKGDRQSYLDYFSDITTMTQSFDLELSPDLDDLEFLEEALQAPGEG